MDSMQTEVFCDHPCELGEGPLWHPERKELFWFDINQQILFSKKLDDPSTPPKRWIFDLPVSAAAIIDHDYLLIAKADGLYRFHINKGESVLVHGLEEGITDNRSNDGRVAPDGSFWIGTMSYRSETGRPGAGNIYRYYRGKLFTLIKSVGIPNSICFDVDDRIRCYWSDSRDKRIYFLETDLEELSQLEEISPSRVRVLVDGISGNPDGSVIDSAHRLWNAEWGSGKLVCYNRQGKVEEEIGLPVTQPSCPAFMGDKMNLLAVTSAYVDLREAERKQQPQAGMTLIMEVPVPGKPEYVLAE